MITRQISRLKKKKEKKRREAMKKIIRAKSKASSQVDTEALKYATLVGH